jgi:hypothetical protein
VKFQIEDPKRAARLAVFRSAEDPTDIGDEIALCRLLAEEAANSGHVGLASQIAHVIAKSTLLQVQAKARMGELLDRHALFQAGSRICEQLTQRLAHLPNYPEIVDAIIPVIIDGLKSAGHEPLLLTQDAPQS